MQEEYDIGSSVDPTTPSAPEAISDAQDKQALIKDIRDLQEGLGSLLARVDKTSEECAKQSSHNEMMATYVDNLTRNKVLAAGNR